MVHRMHWLGAVLILVWLTACGSRMEQIQLSEPITYTAAQAPPRTDFLAYRDAEYPFALHLPREWYIGQLDGEARGILVASSNDAAQPRAVITVMVEAVGAAADLDTMVAAAEETLRAQKGIAGWQVDLARRITVNALAGQERWYRYELNKTKVRQRTIYLQAQDRLYAVSLIAPPELYTQHETLFSDVLASFTGAES